MKKTATLLLALLVMLCTQWAAAQVNYTANDVLTPYDGYFHPGINLGYYGANWDDNQLADLSAGNETVGVDGIGIKALRGSLPEGLGLTFTYDIWKNKYKYNAAVGTTDNLLFLGFASEEHKDKTDYCDSNDIPTDMFANLYEPIWDNGENGTPVNDENYYALYVYEVVSRLKDQVKFWEIWNEPGFDFTGAKGYLPPGAEGNWWENNPDPCDYKLRAPIFNYIRTLRISYEVIKTLAPDDYVCVAGLGYDSFLDAVLRNTDNPDDGKETAEYPLGGGAYFDVVGFHAYPHIDGSTRYWDNNLGDFVYTRHSDAGADALKIRTDARQEVLERYGYDDITHPKKEWIATEVNVPSTAFSQEWGSQEVQRNYVMKVNMQAMKLDYTQLHLFLLADFKTEAEATYEFDLMGMYKSISDKLPYQQEIKESGIGLKTMSDALYGTRYDSDRSTAMNLSENIDGGAFLHEDGTYTYALWAKTSTDLSEEASATYTFPASFGLTAMIQKNWDYSATGDRIAQAAGSIPLTGAPSFIRRLEEDQDIFLDVSCNMPVEFQITATTPEGGQIVTWDEPTATTNCTGGVSINQTQGPVNGSFFPFGVSEIQYTITNACGDVKYCAFNVKVASTGGGIGDCNLFRWEMGFVGQFQGNKYFVSKVKKDFAGAQAQAAGHGGYLASIDSPEENEFLRQQVNDLALIGYNDVAQEGMLEWTSGKDVVFTNVANCQGCPNSEAGDVAMFNHFNGEWYFVPASQEEYFIMELPCAEVPPCICTTDYDPVCGPDGTEYSNSCFAECDGVFNYGVCSDTCALSDLAWLDELIEQAGCDNLDLEISSFESNGSTYTLIDVGTSLSPDGDYSVYNCAGTTVCTETGINTPSCTDLFGTDFTNSTTLFFSAAEECPCICTTEYDPVCSPDGTEYSNSCFAECEGVFDYASCNSACTLDQLQWVSDIIAQDDCNNLDLVISSFEYLDDTYIIVDDGSSVAVDGGFVVYDCEQNLLCSESGFGLPLCTDLFNFNVESTGTIFWSAEFECEDPCVCDAEYDPVCGPDGTEYSNSCIAECEGVFNYISCNSACGLDSLQWVNDLIDEVDCTNLDLVISSFVYINNTYIIVDDGSSIHVDGGYVVFDCDQNLICSEGGDASASCLEVFNFEVGDVGDIYYSAAEECNEACVLSEQQWLQDTLASDGFCDNNCIGTISSFVFNDSTYVYFDGNGGNCTDYFTEVFSCDGTLLCQDGGLGGLTECTSLFGDAPFLNPDTLWLYSECEEPCGCTTEYDPVCGPDGTEYSNSCIAECEGVFDYGPCSEPCVLAEQQWLQDTIASETLCQNTCISYVASFEFDESTYVIFDSNGSNCADYFTDIYSCEGDLVCQEGGAAGLMECSTLFGEAPYMNADTLWALSECEPCNCATEYDPVCGPDGTEYSNSCFAECEGVFNYGPCNTDCTLSEQQWLEDLIAGFDCSNLDLAVYSFNYQGQEYVLFDDGSSVAVDGGYVIYNCDGTLLCTEAGFGSPWCGDIFGPDYVPFTTLLWSAELECDNPCDLSEQDWLNTMLNDSTFCNNGCISSVLSIDYNQTQVVAVMGHLGPCADYFTEVFSCSGTLICREGGFAGLTGCTELLGANFEVDADTLWSPQDCIEEMPCGIEDKDWVDEKIEGLDCGGCIESLVSFEWNDSTFVAEFPDENSCDDVGISVYDCNGDLFCFEGGKTGSTECSEYFGEEFDPELDTLWSKEADCEDCDLNNLDWLDEKLATTDCLSCVQSISTFVVDGVTYIAEEFIEPNTCSDTVGIVYTCDGEIFCFDGGPDNSTVCSEFFEDTDPVDFEVLWDRDEACEDCGLEDLVWLQNKIDSLDCNSCINAIYIVEIDGIEYVYETGPSYFGGSIDCYYTPFTTMYNCQGDTICQDLDDLWLECMLLIEAADTLIFIDTLWTKPKDCEECNLDELAWLDSLLVSETLCEDCIISIETYTFNDYTYIVAHGDNENCSDAQTIVYRCDGSIYCVDGGITGSSECNLFFILAEQDSILWDQEIECIDDATYTLQVQALEMFPNPADDVVRISFDSEQGMQMQYSIMNITGQVMIEGEYTASSGSNKIEIDLDQLVDGMYMVRLVDIDSAKERSLKLVIQ